MSLWNCQLAPYHIPCLNHVAQVHPFTDLELLRLSVHHGNFRLTLGTFYCPPNAPVDILDQLQSSLENIKFSRFNSLVLLGDFNVDFGSRTGSLFTKLENTMGTFILKQMVTEPTHFHSSGSSMIDLVFASRPTSVPHSLLLYNISATGLHPVLVQWIGAYLTSRSQRTIVG